MSLLRPSSASVVRLLGLVLLLTKHLLSDVYQFADLHWEGRIGVELPIGLVLERTHTARTGDNTDARPASDRQTKAHVDQSQPALQLVAKSFRQTVGKRPG